MLDTGFMAGQQDYGGGLMTLVSNMYSPHKPENNLGTLIGHAGDTYGF